jgi:hypothetical protein
LVRFHDFASANAIDLSSEHPQMELGAMPFYDQVWAVAAYRSTVPNVGRLDETTSIQAHPVTNR